jgi:hypothetical protein
MPDRDFYAGLSLREQLRRFAEHHYDEKTRHISADEHEMLLQMSDALPDDEDPEADE